jgi:hypothetical protein
MTVGAIRTLSRTLDSAVPGPPSDDSSASNEHLVETPAGAMDATSHWSRQIDLGADHVIPAVRS